MPDILVSPERLREVAKEFLDASKETRKIAKHLDEEMKSLQNQWKSSSQQSFYRDFVGWQEYAAGHSKLLESIGKEMEALASRFDKVEKHGT